jgi:hypothetical protein
MPCCAWVTARHLPAGVKDPDALCSRRLLAAHIRAAAAAAPASPAAGSRALELLQTLAGELGAAAGGGEGAAGDEERAAVQLLLGDTHFQVTGRARCV